MPNALPTVDSTGMQPGTLVTDSVRLVRHLSEGGMGSVWIGYHMALNTQVAVKFISDLDTANEEVLARFQREATAAARIKSPHVVKTFDQGVMADNTPYIVMELMEGEGLGDVMDRERQLKLNEVASIMSQACRGLHAAHKRGIVHRDIKPDNIFLCPSDEGTFVKLLDFGIAKQTMLAGVGYTTANACMGTPDYMSPEQIQSSSTVDFQADLWALAVIIYEAVTGALPFWADTDGGLLVNILVEDAPPPRELRADLPPEIDVFFARALNKDIKARFSSAMEMAAAFASMIPGASDIEDEITSSGLDIGFDTAASEPLGGLADLLGEGGAGHLDDDDELDGPTDGAGSTADDAELDGPTDNFENTNTPAPVVDEASTDIPAPVDIAIPAPTKKRRSTWLAVALGLGVGLAGVVAAQWVKQHNTTAAEASTESQVASASEPQPSAVIATTSAPAAASALPTPVASSAAPSATPKATPRKVAPWPHSRPTTNPSATQKTPPPKPSATATSTNVDHGF